MQRNTFLGSTLLAVLFLCAHAAPAQTSEGTIKLKVGVIFKSGEVKPLARTDFYVLTKDLDQISLEAAQAQNLKMVEGFEEYIDKQFNASPELKAWLKQRNIRSFPMAGMGGLLDLSQDSFEKARAAVSLDDLFTIPEFHSWLQKPQEAKSDTPSFGFSALRDLPKYPKLSGDKAKDDEKISKYRETLKERMTRTDRDGKTKPNYWVASMLFYLADGRRNLAYDQEMIIRRMNIAAAGRPIAPKYSFKVVKTSLAGEAEITLPVGTYWLSNIEYSRIGQSLILWNHRVVVESGKITQVELSNDNAQGVI